MDCLFTVEIYLGGRYSILSESTSEAELGYLRVTICSDFVTNSYGESWDSSLKKS